MIGYGNDGIFHLSFHIEIKSPADRAGLKNPNDSEVKLRSRNEFGMIMAKTKPGCHAELVSASG